MNSTDIKEYSIEFKNETELQLIIVIYYRYGMISEDSKKATYSGFYKKAYFSTTPDRYIEMINAFAVLKELYKKEEKVAKNAIFLAFRKRHDLYYNPTEEEWKKIKKEKEKKKTKKEKEEEEKLDRMARGISLAMDEAIIHKQLK